MSRTSLIRLFTGVRNIVANQKQIEKLKGERFNIFRILNMERDETAAHTPFLANLLNPAGSHDMGAVFLRHFVETVRTDKMDHLAGFDWNSARVIPNYYIGPVVTTDGQESGGYLDIYIKDGRERSITLENKIDPHTEQKKQVVRYHNFNSARNTVLYLTPEGSEPSSYSRGSLEPGTHFFLVSYKEHITEWLSRCLREAADKPILRETIKQYIVLIKRITMTTDDQLQQQLTETLMAHFEEAAWVVNNFNKAKFELLANLRREVVARLTPVLGKGYKVSEGVPVTQKYAQVWIEFDGLQHYPLCFGIESFNGEGNFGGRLYVGMFNQDGKENSFTKEQGGRAKWWYQERYITLDGADVFFSDNALLVKLVDPATRQLLINRIIEETKAFVDEYEPVLKKHLGLLAQVVEG
ncbi:PD-(D/E)XK nuclease family protein [Flaviaesturariibacter amylovorans]|uniref:PDDEXK-like family protein n=1 Tax=Flaviaesturariibacter amylovorans TaxID=1084520 RepID=UPI0031EC826E